MDHKVILSPRAIQDLSEVVRYISADNPQAATRFGNALIDASLSLQTFPERGRFVPEFADEITREIIYGSYRIIYRIRAEQKTARFWHAARGTPHMR